MRLLLTTDTVGGVWTYAVELARALGPHGIQIALATMGAPIRPDQREQARALDHVTVHESTFRLDWMQDPWDDVARAGDWLLGLEARVRPDVVHLNGYAHGALPWQSPVLVVGHSCVLSWWQAVKGEPAGREWAAYGHAVRRGLRAADAVAAPTAAMLEELGRLYGPPPEGVVIPNGRDAAAFRPAAKEPFVLSAGRLWDEAKNLAALERVAPRLPWPVYVAGDDRSPDGAAADAQTRHTQPLGRLDERAMADWLGRAAIYALPAKYEPFGLSALEAALAGCALVLGDIPSLREVWGDAALFVKPDDADALSGAIRSLTSSPALREEMATRARRRAREYAPERMAERYMSVYRRLMEGFQVVSSKAGKPEARNRNVESMTNARMTNDEGGCRASC
jgi:glycosyltransferase involved in cell wall biosynthesis